MPWSPRTRATAAPALLRLADDALLAHAHDVHYDPRVWRAQAITQTAVNAGVGCGARVDELPLAAEELRRAAIALADAIAAVDGDPMAVPTHLAATLSGWLLRPRPPTRLALAPPDRPLLVSRTPPYANMCS